jgi:hypothetical protein
MGDNTPTPGAIKASQGILVGTQTTARRTITTLTAGQPLFGAVLGKALAAPAQVQPVSPRFSASFKAFTNFDAPTVRRAYQPALRLPNGAYMAQPSITAPMTAQQALKIATTPPPDPVAAKTDTVSAASRSGSIDAGQPMALADYPHPAGDTGRGMHWVPTTSSSPAVVDRFVKELKDMHISWCVLLNNGANVGDNDYLVKQLVKNNIEPVMRIHTSGLSPVDGNLTAAVKHYKSLGVSYFQLYNEPNLKLENGGKAPDVNRYLDAWIPAAKAVIAGGGLPGFGSLSPQGDVDDKQFLKQSLDGLKARGESGLLNTSWLSLHNYGSNFLQFRDYDKIIQNSIGRTLPVISTEGGIYQGKTVSAADQKRIVTDAFKYMQKRDKNYFAYTYWIIANEEGGGLDKDFTTQALFQPDGVSPIVQALKDMGT